MNKTPDIIKNEKELHELLTTPNQMLIDFMKELEGDLIILGIAGKMGVDLGILAKKAAKLAGVDKKVIGVARFSNPDAKTELEDAGIETISCDLLDPEAVSKLPNCKNVIYMAAKKFGTQGDESMTWAMNTLVPGYVARHFKESRIVVFSTGCVYPLADSVEGGSTEDITPNPIGDYAMSCMGREMMFNYGSKQWGTEICQFRLNYSVDLRYGVLHDIAQKILNNEVVDLNSSHFNVIWQGDACSQAILCLGQCSNPPNIMNITGPELASVKLTAEKLANHMNKKVTFSGTPGGKTYLNNSEKATALFGYPKYNIDTLIKWQAHWVLNGNKSLGKATKFEVTNGKF